MKVHQGDLTFVCEDPHEVARAQSLYTKEPGTIAWLRDTLTPGDVVYDIGANIGCYSLVAARLVGPTGHVYAFEPHLLNAASLLRNIQANGLTDVITVVATPLGERSALLPFHYTSLRPGSSGHQFGRAVGETGVAFTPAVSVLAQGMRLDELAVRRAPTVAKIDVDGLELQVLHGMLGCFGELLRSLQVEIHPADRTPITRYLAARGYHPASRHYTQQGQKAVDAGATPDSITDNAIFERGTP
jgi:FkbM family methyltransferase